MQVHIDIYIYMVFIYAYLVCIYAYVYVEVLLYSTHVYSIALSHAKDRLW